MKPRSKFIWGIILVAIGIILLGETTGLFTAEDLFGTFIPIAMIAIGAWLIFRRKSVDDAKKYAPPPPPPPTYSSGSTYSQAADTDRQANADTGAQQSTGGASVGFDEPRISQSPETDGAGKLKYRKTFGDMYIDCAGVNLQNIEVSAGFGDLEIRLHDGVLGDGLNRLIISSFIGDIRIMAPSGMAVFTHCSNFVGDVEVMGKRASGFGNSIDAQTVNYQDSTKKLYVACNSFIGDIKIYGL